MSIDQDAIDVREMVKTRGWKVMETWLNKQITNLRDRDEKSVDIDNPRISVLSCEEGMKIIAVSIDKGYNNHAVRAFRTLLSKVKDFVEEPTDG